MYMMARANTRYARGCLKSGIIGCLIRPGRYLRGVVLAGYELFLKLPVAMVLAVLWLVGAAFLGSCLLALYLCPKLLMRAVS
jgi:hypothetical protein